MKADIKHWKFFYIPWIEWIFLCILFIILVKENEYKYNKSCLVGKHWTRIKRGIDRNVIRLEKKDANKRQLNSLVMMACTASEKDTNESLVMRVNDRFVT